MFATLLSVALFAVAAVRGVSAQDPSVNNVTLTQCESSTISWSATTGPYALLIVSADDPCGEPLIDAGDFNGTTAQVTVTIAAGQTVLVYLEDENGNEGWSSELTVQPSSDTACLTNGTSSTSSSSAASSVPTTLVVPAAAAEASPTSSSSSASAAASGSASNALSSGSLPSAHLLGVPALTVLGLLAGMAIAL